MPSVEYWQQRYQEGSTGWDLNEGAPPFVNLLKNDRLVPGKIAVIGCGSGEDALLFAERGFEVTGFDFAPAAISLASAAARSRGLNAQFIQRDIFQLLPEFANSFDWVLEHTCFCAIDPQDRLKYVEIVRGILKPDGRLIGLFFTHSRPGGPPFGSDPAEIKTLFSNDFQIISLDPVSDSTPKRQGEEHLGIFQKVG